MLSLDSTDLHILKLLQEDAKMTMKEIAGKMDLTITPVYERIRSMEREGVVKKYMAIVDLEKLGFEFMVFCEVSLKSHSLDFIREFTRAIENVNEVVECYHIAGPYDYLLKVIVKTMDDYQHFVLSRLSTLNNIGKVQSMFVLKEVIEPRVEMLLKD